MRKNLVEYTVTIHVHVWRVDDNHVVGLRGEIKGGWYFKANDRLASVNAHPQRKSVKLDMLRKAGVLGCLILGPPIPGSGIIDGMQNPRAFLSQFLTYNEGGIPRTKFNYPLWLDVAN